MSRKTETRLIEGLSVSVTQPSAMDAYAMFASLGTVIGPAVAELGNVKLASNLEDTDVSSVTPALAMLLQGLSRDRNLVGMLMSCVKVDMQGAEVFMSDEAKINLAFSGKFKAMLLTLKFVLEVAFADFLGDGLAALQGLQAKASD